MISANADHMCVLWDVMSGKKITEFQLDTPVRAIQFAEGDRQFLCVTDSSYRNTPAIHIFNIPPAAMEDNDYNDQGRRMLLLSVAEKLFSTLIFYSCERFKLFPSFLLIIRTKLLTQRTHQTT